MKNKIIVLGDTHGINSWKKIVNQTFDKVVFIGDYFDSFHVSAREQMQNFSDIIEFKKKNLDKVVLLLGNHDYHYLEGSNEHYSGFQYYSCGQISDMVHNALDKGYVDLCHVDGKYLFTHAGVTKTWAKANNIVSQNKDLNYSFKRLFKQNIKTFGFNKNGRDNSGDDMCQGPLWVRPKSLEEDLFDSYVQVVGHTPIKKIKITESIIYIDTIETSRKYLVIENGIALIKQLDT